MVKAAELAGALDRSDIRGLLDGADDRVIAASIAADRADIVLGEVEAMRARLDALGKCYERIGEPLALLRRLSEEMIGEPKRRLSPDPGKLCQLRSESVDCRHLRTEA